MPFRRSRTPYAPRHARPKVDMAAIREQQAASDRRVAEDARITQQAIDAAAKAAQFVNPNDPFVKLMRRVDVLEAEVARLKGT